MNPEKLRDFQKNERRHLKFYDPIRKIKGCKMTEEYLQYLLRQG